MYKATSQNFKDTSTRVTVLEAEDEIISIFCQNNGGMEFAMPIIRKQFTDAGVNFKNPTKDELIIIVDKLVEITKELQGEAMAKEEFRDYMHIINKINE